MRKLLIFIFLCISTFVHAESIVSKQDADNIFSMSFDSWESYTKMLHVPDGWKMQLRPIDTGTSVMSFNTLTGYGMSTQPLYSSRSANSPDILIISTYYPKGTFVKRTDEFTETIKSGALKDLGPGYSVAVRLIDTRTLEGFELQIHRVTEKIPSVKK